MLDKDSCRQHSTSLMDRGAAVSGARALGLARLPVLLLAALLLGCQANGVPRDPISVKLQWFSFLDGADLREACSAAGPDRYRLIYNAVFEEQVRVYELTAYEDGGTLMARAAVPGFALYQTDEGVEFGWQTSEARLGRQEVAEFHRRLEESGFYAAPPVGLELYSTDFYWIAMGCEDGEFRYTAFARPSPAFEALSFPEFLFARDATGLAVNPPRDIPASERLRVTGGGIGSRDERRPGFRLVLGENGLKGTQPLL